MFAFLGWVPEVMKFGPKFLFSTGNHRLSNKNITEYKSEIDIPEVT